MFSLTDGETRRASSGQRYKQSLPEAQAKTNLNQVSSEKKMGWLDQGRTKVFTSSGSDLTSLVKTATGDGLQFSSCIISCVHVSHRLVQQDLGRDYSTRDSVLRSDPALA